MATELDSYDKKILVEVQENARVPQSDLGERVSLSAAAVNRRLKRLLDERVIEKYTAVVAPKSLNYGLTIVVTVEVESEQIELLDTLKREFEACPQVQQCYYVAGEWDFVLIFIVKDMDQYNALTRSLFFGNNNVKRFKTLVTMDRVKVGLDVPIEL